MSYALGIKHNIEVAHRLSLLPGKCEAIHGHSMWVDLEVHSRAGDLDANYLVDGLEFGAMKKAFRGYLDEEFDHRLLLNATDIWAQPIYRVEPQTRDLEGTGLHGKIDLLVPTAGGQQEWLPGLRLMDGDPSTENIAREIGKWAQQEFGLEHFYVVTVHETKVNMARWQG